MPEMTDYRDDHSPDIALLLTVADAVRALLIDSGDRQELWNEITDAMKPFEHYPDPVERQDREPPKIQHPVTTIRHRQQAPFVE